MTKYTFVSKNMNKEIVTAGKLYIRIGIGLIGEEKQYIAKDAKQFLRYQIIQDILDKWGE